MDSVHSRRLTAIVSQIIDDLRKSNKMGFSITATGPGAGHCECRKREKGFKEKELSSLEESIAR